MNRIQSFAALVVFVATIAGGAAANAKTLTVTNKTNKAVTLSDFYTFTDEKNSQGKKEVLKKGDATDDATIAAGGKKNITIDDNVKSVTISWLNANGKEVETDWGTSDFTINEKDMAMFIAPAFGGKFAMACAAPAGALPADGANVNIVNGKISGGLYDWITFYDVTASNGDIARDVNGNPTSPLLNGVAMSVDHHYGAVVATYVPGISPAGVVALLLGLLLLSAWMLRRRRIGVRA